MDRVINLNKNQKKPTKPRKPWFNYVHEVDRYGGAAFFYFISIAGTIFVPVIGFLLYGLIIILTWMVGGDHKAVDVAMSQFIGSNFEIIGRAYCWSVLGYFLFWITVDVLQRQHFRNS